MKLKIHNLIKKVLIHVLPNSDRIRYLSYLPKLREWKRKHSENYPVFINRFELYDFINNEKLKSGSVDYLEFGVYRGRSIKKWSKINTDNNSRFYGFDTFEGLPEKWKSFLYSLGENHFSTKGEIPAINDKRVSFIKGLFQEALVPFLNEVNIKNRLVVNMDADLYSSTLYVLTKLDQVIVPGTIVIFDEFSSVMDEFRALEDYSLSHMKDYKVIGATKNSGSYYAHVAIEFL